MAGFHGPATPDRKPRGWHAFTAAQRGAGDPSAPAAEAFPALSGMQSSAVDLNPEPAPIGTVKPLQGCQGRRVRSSSPPGRLQGRGVYQQSTPPLRGSSRGGEFVPGVDPTSGAVNASWRWKAGGRADAVQRVKDVAPSADASLIGDLLEGLHGNIESAITQLQEMGLVETPTTGFARDSHVESDQRGPGSNQRDSPGTYALSISDGVEKGSLRRNSRSEGELAELEREIFREGGFDGHWERSVGMGDELQEDPYYKYRGDAIRLSRGRARHAKSAANAFTLGDHSRARELARLAREEGEVARELHAQAAEKILAERNADRLGGIWEIDLHGLHANEAVVALCSRLEEVEAEVSAILSLPINALHSPSRDVSARSGSSSQNGGSVRKVSELPSFRKELMVITGTGNHSKGGPTLPSIVSSFLIENGYSFRQARSGVLAVRPKYRLDTKRGLL